MWVCIHGVSVQGGPQNASILLNKAVSSDVQYSNRAFTKEAI